MIDVTFQHWRYVFSDDMLTRYGSSYYSRKEAGQIYTKNIFKHGVLIATENLSFNEAQILCGNEAFPEAAVADPIADLEVWYEWGRRRQFPYPGRYSRLGITRQEPKTSSTASVGVIGEIMAGFFAQAGVSPWVLVRVIRHWPDFIFSHPADQTYSFVESKAFTVQPSGRDGLRSRVPDSHISEGAIRASQELLTCPSLKIWLSFTYIAQVTPIRLDVTFLELLASEGHRKANVERTIPTAVAEGLAERAINQAAAQVGLDKQASLPFSEAEDVKRDSRGLRGLAEREFRRLLEEAGFGAPTDIEVHQLGQALERVLQRIRKKHRQELQGSRGSRLSAAKEEAANSLLSSLRRVGGQDLYLADLTPDQQADVRKNWDPGWSIANRPWGQIHEIPLWRCGGAVFCLGGPDLAHGDIYKEAVRGR
jgi:hypothetical protein